MMTETKNLLITTFVSFSIWFWVLFTIGCASIDRPGAVDSPPPTIPDMAYRPDQSYTPDLLHDMTPCVAVKSTTKPQTPVVHLLIDQSGSMNDKFGTTTRWEAMKSSLVGMGGVVDKYDEFIYFGASLYTTKNNICPSFKTVPAALSNFSTINTLLTTNSPGSETPTGEAIDSLLATFMANPDNSNGKHIIVLVTDGQPDTCQYPNPRNQNEQNIANKKVVDSAAKAFAMGYEFYVVSVGTDTVDAHLQAVANAGVGAPAGQNAPFFKVTNTAEMDNVFHTLTQNALSCKFDVPTWTLGEPSKARVYLNSTTVPFSATDGWYVESDIALRLTGSYCQAYLTSPGSLVTADVSCDELIM